MLILIVIIYISSNGGTHSSCSIPSSGMTMVFGKTVTAVPMMFGISEKMPWVA